MTSSERQKLDDYRRLSDREKERWSRNASEQERADMERLISMNKYEALQLTRNQLDRIKQTSSDGTDELDRIMKLAGIKSGLRKPPETNK